MSFQSFNGFGSDGYNVFLISLISHWVIQVGRKRTVAAGWILDIFQDEQKMGIIELELLRVKWTLKTKLLWQDHQPTS